MKICSEITDWKMLIGFGRIDLQFRNVILITAEGSSNVCS